MFVDECGNQCLKSSIHDGERYLAVTGVIFDLEYESQVVEDELDILKTQFFNPPKDGRPIIFHRNCLTNQRSPFEALRDPKVNDDFERAWFDLLRRLEYSVITAVIDKRKHLERYGERSYHPYHFALELLLERYVLWLRDKGGIGDILAESRGKNEDKPLKKIYTHMYDNGIRHISKRLIQKKLSSSNIKMNKKKDNVAGLQIADSIAHPSWRVVLARTHGRDLDGTFGGKIGKLLEDSKYVRNVFGIIRGYGWKLFP